MLGIFNERYEVRLKEKRHEYGDVYTFVFHSDVPIPFEAGQYAHVKIPGLEGKSVRELSFASAPENGEVWFTVHIRQESPWKVRLANMAAGEAIELFKIKGDIFPTDAGEDAVLIGGGIGVTPFRSILWHLSHKNWPVMPVLLHVARDNFLFREEFSLMPIEQHYLGRGEFAPMLATICAEHLAARYFVAGAPDFVRDTSVELGKLGIAAENIFATDFDGYTDLE